MIWDSQLIIDFANRIARPSKAKLFLVVQKLCELEKKHCLSAQIVYQQVLHEEKKIANCFAMLQDSCSGVWT